MMTVYSGVLIRYTPGRFSWPQGPTKRPKRAPEILFGQTLEMVHKIIIISQETQHDQYSEQYPAHAAYHKPFKATKSGPVP